MKKRIIWLIGICMMAAVVAAGVWYFTQVKNREDDPYMQVAKQIWQMESILKEKDASFSCTAISRVTPFTYSDKEGNTIVYYCCQTTYLSETPGEYTGLDMEAIGVVIDLERIGNERECAVGIYDGFLCEIGERTYLCWTLSLEISCVIEYSTETADEADIFRMAESIAVPET